MAFCLALCVSGCTPTRLMFLPMNDYRLTPDRIGLHYRTIRHSTPDGVTLTSWYLNSKKPARGIVLFLHGNAENISTHLGSVYWLPEHGYDVFLLDYRGFGQSTGSPSIPEVFADIQSGFDWILQNNSESLPIFILGQSIGAGLAVKFSANPNIKKNLTGVSIDAAFTSYSEITRHALNQSWLTWAFQYPVSWLLDNKQDPIKFIDEIAPVPLLIFHSEDDQIIPFHHGEQLFAAAADPKFLVRSHNRHIETFNHEDMRRCLLDFFSELTVDC